MPDAEPLAAFDDELVEAVAEETGAEVGALREALRRQQTHARSLPGVDDLVFEWRRFLPYDPLIDRGERAYYLVFEPSVWAEFADQLSFDDATLAAVKSVHDRQLRRRLAALGEDDDVLKGGAALVLTR